MIEIGLSTWADHPQLSTEGKDRSTLQEYATNFPIVEVDSSFYAIPSLSNVVNWQHQVSENFQFILKASKLMTLHDFPELDGDTFMTPERRIEFTTFNKILQPLVKNQQLTAVLFQFPPTFRCELPNIRYLFEIREQIPNLPIIVEFRNASWLTDPLKQDTLAYLTRLKMSNVVVDEPFDGNQGMPMVETITNSKLAVFRLHGQNQQGWLNPGANWRSERTNYRYSDLELKQLADKIKSASQQAEKTVVIFNNNGNHDAVDNAKKLQTIMGLHFDGLGPMQLDLF